MEELEDSTLDLIYRRKVRSRFSGYVILFLLVSGLLSLPLVKIDVVTSVRGMVRPHTEPSELFASQVGIVDSSLLVDNARVDAGDTLVWICRDLPEAKLKAMEAQIRILKASANDIQLILAGKKPFKTARYRQSYKNHLTARSRLEVRKEFLSGEYSAARFLLDEEVISQHEYEKARSDYLHICASESDLCEAYRNSLEGDLFRIRSEMKASRDEIELTRSSLDHYYIRAPVSGTLFGSRYLSSGSIVHTGMSLGKISPSGLLAAECHIHPGLIASVKKGSRVKLRFDNRGFRSHHPLEARVDLVDEEISMFRGNPSYRIRCTLQDTKINYTNGSTQAIKNGMTFTASIFLFRHSLASLILDKVNLWLNPTASAGKNEKGA